MCISLDKREGSSMRCVTEARGGPKREVQLLRDMGEEEGEGEFSDSE